MMEHREELFNLPNVIGYFTGKKSVGGIETSQQSVVVLVKEKVPSYLLGEEDKIPEVVDDLPTDVIAGPIVPLVKNIHRPFMIGDEIGLELGGSRGTLGLIFRLPDGRDYGLTNWHVVYRSMTGEGNARRLKSPDDLEVSGYVQQPAGIAHWFINEHGEQENRYRIGELTHWCSPYNGNADAAAFVLYGSTMDPPRNAMGHLKPGTQWDAQIDKMYKTLPQYGFDVPPVGFPHYHLDYNAHVRSSGILHHRVGALGYTDVGDRVWKAGSTTGITHGKVIATDMTVMMRYAHGNVVVSNKIAVRKDDELMHPNEPLAAGGDSGSTLIDESSHVVGLLFAGNGNMVIADPIQDVFTSLFDEHELRGVDLIAA